MVRITVYLIAAATVFSGAAKLDDDARNARKHFATCPGAGALREATDISWEPQQSRLQEHEALRERLHAPIPQSPSRVLFWSSGAHHTSVSFSVIAVRDARGRWHTNGVGEERSGLLPIQPHPLQVLDRDLSSEQSRALYQALVDPCLYASPRFQRDAGFVAGGAVQTVEIETPKHRWIGSWFGVRTPQEDTLVNLVTN